MKRFNALLFSFVVNLAVVEHMEAKPTTFVGPSPYLSTGDIPASFYAGGSPTGLEDFEDQSLDFGITASAGTQKTLLTQHANPSRRHWVPRRGKSYSPAERRKVTTWRFVASASEVGGAAITSSASSASTVQSSNRWPSWEIAVLKSHCYPFSPTAGRTQAKST